MKPLRQALQNGPSPMAIRHSWQKLFKVFTVPTQRERSIGDLYNNAIFIMLASGKHVVVHTHSMPYVANL